MIDYSNQCLVLDKNFLSQDRCQDIKDKVFAVRDQWQNCQIENFSFLPFGLYSVPLDIYKNNVAKYKELMWHLFGLYYEKIQSTVQTMFDIKVDFHDQLNYPGFHISNSSMSNPNFHKDQFSNFNFFSKGLDRLNQKPPKIFSFIIPISIPRDGAGLLIRQQKQKLENRHLQNYDKMLEYQIGMLAVWDGDIEHSIRPFKILSADDFRITMQFHLAMIRNKQGYLFW